MRTTTLLLSLLLPLTAQAQTREAGPWWPHPEWGAMDQAGASNRITVETAGTRVAAMIPASIDVPSQGSDVTLSFAAEDLHLMDEAA